LAERFRQSGRPRLRLDTDFGGDATRYVAEAVLEETFRDQIGTGYLAETAGGFRPTLKGALIMTWQELWPLKNLRRRRERQHAERLLSELEPQLTGPA
jgi:hypothetical protein